MRKAAPVHLMNHPLHHGTDDRSHRHHKSSMTGSRVPLRIPPCHMYSDSCWPDRMRCALTEACRM